jgi:hypothetical protein
MQLITFWYPTVELTSFPVALIGLLSNPTEVFEISIDALDFHLILFSDLQDSNAAIY